MTSTAAAEAAPLAPIAARLVPAGLGDGAAPRHAEAYEQAFRRYGDVVRFRVGPPGARIELYLLCHPDAAHRVLAGASANYRKDNVFYAEVRSAFGNGLLTSEDADWQRRSGTCSRCSGRSGWRLRRGDERAGRTHFVQRWRTRLPGTAGPHDEMTRLTLGDRLPHPVGEDLGQVLPVVQRRSTRWATRSAAGRSPAAAAPGLAHPGQPTTAASTARAARRLRRDRRRRRASGERRRTCWGCCSTRATRALADRRRGARPGAHLPAGRPRDHLDRADLYAAPARPASGRAATGCARRWPRSSATARRPRHAAALAYTTMVLKETMRLYPSAPLLGRRAVEEDVLGGYRIPAGADVVIAPWVVHRHPGLLGPAAPVRPAAVRPGAGEGPGTGTRFPFGGGPRALHRAALLDARGGDRARRCWSASSTSSRHPASPATPTTSRSARSARSSAR